MAANRVADALPVSDYPGATLEQTADLRRMPIETSVGRIREEIGLFFYPSGTSLRSLTTGDAVPGAGLVMSLKQARLMSQALATYCDRIEAGA